MVEEKLIEIKENINNIEEFKPYTFDIDIIENSSGKIMNLIKNLDDFTYPLRNEYYKFKFVEPIYIQKVIFNTDDSCNLKDMEIVSIDHKDNSSTIHFSNKEHTTWTPNKIIKEFRFKAPKRFINKIILTSIDIVGFKLDDLEIIKDNLSHLANFKDDLQTISDDIKNKNIVFNETIEITEEKIANNKDEIKTLTLQISELEDDIIPALQDSKISYEENINKLSLKKESLESDNTKLKNNVEQLTEESNQLNIEISNQTNELKKLTDDTNIFSTEMKSYIEQGNKDIKLYTFLSIIPWLLILSVSGIVFFGASNLTTIINTSDSISITTIFWSRIPFVLIVISILFVSYEISKIFIKNIIHIHKQKRIFTKIGILAKDVADQSILDLEIDEKEKFELRTKLKMDLLKSHLKNEIGEDYEYKVKTSLLEYIPYINNKINQVPSDSKGLEK
jgi:hypothetical protein